MPARAARALVAGSPWPPRPGLDSPAWSRNHRPSRSTSTRPSATMLARKGRSDSASCSRRTSTRRPAIDVSFELRSTTRSRLGSRRSATISTSLVGVSNPVAAEPKSSAKRTLCSVRRASLRRESSGQLRRTYCRSAKGRASVLTDGLTAWSVPSLTARRKVLSCTPTSAARRPSSVICPLYSRHVSVEPPSCVHKVGFG
jgi:hypothetical protein